MPERVFPSSADAPVIFPNWSAIWAGTFTFVAIWSVFGLLGAAIFASVANPTNPVPALGLGMGIWTVVLMIVAMFIAGRTTGRLAGRIDALLTGTVTFGLSVTAALIVAYFGRIGVGALAAAAGGALGASRLWLFASPGWIGFVALLLGWIAAIAGASSTRQRRMAQSPADQRIGQAA